MNVFSVHRLHEICLAHRLVDHPGACARIHGHNYEIGIEVIKHPKTSLNSDWMVADFSFIKGLLCQWLDDNWDHRLMLWDKDPLITSHSTDSFNIYAPGSLVVVPFNPTAEAMAGHLLNNAFPNIIHEYLTSKKQMLTLEVIAISVRETAKNEARAWK